ncbi:DUF3331 domain-containing protein [bacterium M00.F.Ca.ET.228.01.1.1]|uniref:DUF3331 domain-containing protein n=1 Tax=Paraburkholderia phenoliruptrix TaxID=252970 RepID=UPI00109322C6|nr:DUF3331 domain-containing protein [Paraburkholderia phenoliruptrix]MBW9128946.1 DUF3331 domain-containing protein [Paraburkholderia ginsengiterrae]TGP45809.1 DUF3331 domain-containing protein [bacterium M00.F.Ca.ET.228.01.1.1]TGS04279.1 DUF3331 domain-containing protein [bacterium M00.F.Ca.ET.191.01.1.1]TGU07102.1 DUF3331 domain-containing protein [bacterium M00.F.Ca.ET.155.01.1.1]MBW9102663.1 DUF3331 domain-containing protein [Paraburkholderia phenoliruptrix]
MRVLSDENIVVRALLNVLDPSAEQLAACARKSYTPLQRCGVGTRSAMTDASHHRASRPARIAVVEWLSSATISVSWSDSCTGRYAEQIWCSGFARVSCVCALTGRAIRRGDRVFRPRARQVRVPGNRDQVILAEAIEHCTDLPIEGATAASF